MLPRIAVAPCRKMADYEESVRLAGGDDAWADLKGMVVLPPADDSSPATLWWISSGGLNSAVLEAAPDGGLPSPSASSSPAASPGPSPKKTPKPTPKP